MVRRAGARRGRLQVLPIVNPSRDTALTPVEYIPNALATDLKLNRRSVALQTPTEHNLRRHLRRTGTILRSLSRCSSCSVLSLSPSSWARLLRGLTSTDTTNRHRCSTPMTSHPSLAPMALLPGQRSMANRSTRPSLGRSPSRISPTRSAWKMTARCSTSPCWGCPSTPR